MRILQVNTDDSHGGAANVAVALHSGLRRRGHDVCLAVGRRNGCDPDVVEIPNDLSRSAWARWLRRKAGRLPPHSWRHNVLCGLAEPVRAIKRVWGLEDFDYPGTRRLLELPAWRADVLQVHNLHGGYFDLRALTGLTRQMPVVLRLADAWLLSGHCAHSLACPRWQTGCGQCPDLGLYPPIGRDATKRNWRRKAKIFRNCRLNVVTPSAWLMERVNQSMLAPAIHSATVIPNGVDLEVFCPGGRLEARRALGLDPDTIVLLGVGQSLRMNPYKDYDTLLAGVIEAADRLSDRSVTLLVLGDTAPAEAAGRARVRFVPYESDPSQVAMYYRAADIYVHVSRAETFGRAIVEAMACGIPTVASAVGGIPEIITDRVGQLVPAGNAGALADALEGLVRSDDVRADMGRAARRVAGDHFSVDLQVDRYLALFEQLLERHADG